MSMRPRLPALLGWSRRLRAWLPSSTTSSLQHAGSARSAAPPICGHASTRGLASDATTSLATSTSSTPLHIHLPTLPTFRAKGSDIKVLYEPSQFYQYLLGRIKRAKRRIFLASLYIGKEETELIAALHAALKANTALELHIVVDCLRSTREHPQGTSSASLLATLQASFPSRVHISLYHTPALSGLAARLVPKRYNEGWGLWHGKIYGFDDDVVLSGANLSRDYFTNRQDRYIAFRGHAPLADYFHALMQRFKQLSFTLEGYSTATASPRNFDLRWISKGSSGALGTATTHVAQPNTHPRQYTDSAKRILGDFLALYARKSTASLSSPRSPVSTTGGAYDTTLQPFLQMGAFDIKQETDLVVPEVLRAAKESADVRVDWTSGYFSLRKDYRDALLAAKGEVAIVCASPEANGFFQSKGFSKYIPPAYTYLEHRFFDELQRQGKTDSVGVTEWKRSGWTYHAKGVWLSPAAAAAADSGARAAGGLGTGDPALTLVGSTNYGYRSAVRDIEVNLAVHTTSPALRKALGDELRNIHQHATDKVDEALFAREDRRVGWINRLAARVIADML